MYVYQQQKKTNVCTSYAKFFDRINLMKQLKSFLFSVYLIMQLYNEKKIVKKDQELTRAQRVYKKKRITIPQ